MTGGCAPAVSLSTWSACGRLSLRSQPPRSVQCTPRKRLRCPPPARPLNAGRALTPGSKRTRAPAAQRSCQPHSAHARRSPPCGSGLSAASQRETDGRRDGSSEPVIAVRSGASKPLNICGSLLSTSPGLLVPVLIGNCLFSTLQKKNNYVSLRKPQ